EGEIDFQRYFHCSLKIDFPFLITGSSSSHSSPICWLQVSFPEYQNFYFCCVLFFLELE
ncbi:hypothetical protein Goshw_025103, partial [Gossypium schwendimanii]|nr:hypothetical protein [Gossypium schwendimanii]